MFVTLCNVCNIVQMFEEKSRITFIVFQTVVILVTFKCVAFKPDLLDYQAIKTLEILHFPT